MGLTPQQGVGLHLEVGGVFYATRSYLVITHPLVAYCIVPHESDGCQNGYGG